MKKIFILFRCMLTAGLLQCSFVAQTQEPLLAPTAIVYPEMRGSPIETYECPAFDVDALISEDVERTNQGLPPRFAKKFDVEITTANSGAWEEVEGLHLWRYRITSENAHAMMLIFRDMNLPSGASLFLYDDDMSYVVGPVTNVLASNNKGFYPSELIPGSSLVVELVLPGSTPLNTQQPYFTIESISHDYIDIFNMSGAKPLGILDCHKDINCDEGAEWQIHQKAVALILVEGDKFCSGSLINNTAFDGKPYFASASHCFDGTSWERAAKTVFYFNHQKDKCNGNNIDYRTNKNTFKISGATELSLNHYADALLLQLSSVHMPSSYQTYFPGWDRSDNNIPGKGIAIHHPGGNPKKITIDNDSLTTNDQPVTAYSGSGIYHTYDTGALWISWPESGTIEGGSSGSPLFNGDGKIVGRTTLRFNSASYCSPNLRTGSGRFSRSWENMYGNFKHWLDPINTNQTEIQGYIPAGWRNDWLVSNGWAQNANRKMYGDVKSLAVGTGGQVFYRGNDNKMQMYWYDYNTNQWVHDWVRGSAIPNYELIGGDVVVGDGNQLFYRGTDGKIHTYYWNAGSWHHDWLTGWNSPIYENISAEPGSLAIGSGNQLFYRGTDNKMHTYYWNTSGWHHDWIVNGAPSSQNIKGDVIVGTDGGQNQVFYRGTDGKTNVYWYNNATNQFVHAMINPTSAEPVSIVAGSMKVGEHNNIYYRGVNDKMYIHYFNTSTNAWQTSNFVTNPGDEQKNRGNITAMPGQVMYKGTDGKMHVYWYNSGISQWQHDWIENSWQAPTMNNVAGSMDAGQGNQVFYRGTDGFLRVYYFGTGAILRPEDDKKGNVNFALIPKYNATLAMTAYPNPVDDNVNINISSFQDDKYLFTITDAMGRVVLSQEKLLNQGFNKVDFQLSNAIKSGLYILSAQNIRTSEKVQTKITKL